MTLDPGWTWEKSKNIVRELCSLLMLVRRSSATLPPDILHPNGDFFSLLYDATKIMCVAIATYHADANGTRWSPDIPRYLCDHPERCDETIKIIESKDFRDQYYEKGFFDASDSDDTTI